MLKNNLSERTKKYENKKQIEKSINICAGVCHTVWYGSGKCNYSECRIYNGKPDISWAERNRFVWLKNEERDMVADETEWEKGVLY